MMKQIKNTCTTLLLVTLLIITAGCEVSNPGPIEEGSLNSPQAVPGIVVGMSADLSVAFRTTTQWGSVWSDDLTHSGTLGAPTVFSNGVLNSQDIDPWWGSAQRARWVAENGLERMERLLGENFNQSEYSARAYLYAGYSNRILGENSCHAVIDGGERQESTVYFERAEQHFTNALSIAENIGNSAFRNAALAGRASVRAALDDWDGAADDAAGVPVEFRFVAVYSLNSSRENNNWPGITIDRGEYSVYNTQWEASEDPRVPHQLMLTASGDTASAANGITPWITQMKHETDADHIALAKGTEMLLIRAEMELRENQGIPAAMELINEGRAFHGLDPLNAGSLEEAWGYLQSERGADMWLEGRRFWDLRRWVEETGPAYHSFLEDRDRCVPIGQEELDMNENL